MKRTLRLISLVLAMAILLAVPAYAEPEVSPYSSCYFNSFTTYLHQISDGAFQIRFEVIASCGLKDELGVSEIVVQRSTNGTNWEQIKTYYPYANPSMIGYDTAFHSGHVVYVGTQGYYYRAYVTYYAKNSSGTGYYSLYTEVLHLQPMSN